VHLLAPVCLHHVPYNRRINELLQKKVAKAPVDLVCC